MAVHAASTQLRGLAEERKVAKPLTTQFVKRAPRLTKPLELKKRPQPRRRQIQREMVAVKARGTKQESRSSISGLDVAGKLARPRVEMARSTGLTTGLVEPQALAQAVQGSKESQHTLDMSLEMMDISALDTGQYHALVVQDPQDKRSIKGFCHLAIAYSKTLYPTPAKAEDTFEAYALTGFLRLLSTMNEHTDIKADVLGKVGLDDAEIFKAPWLLFWGRLPFSLTPPELGNLGTYLISGGCVFADCRNYYYFTSPAYKSLRNALLDGLATQGVRLEFEKLPPDHPVFHCYFDFDGPPMGYDGWVSSHYHDLGHVVDHVEGLSMDGRLLAILSGKEYVAAWTFWGTSGLPSSDMTMDARRQLEFGVNTIIFALTQEGSITRRLLESVQ
jgi:hypothetical protein